MNTQNTPELTQHASNTAHSISDLAEALRALQRVCGFSHNHNDIFLACLAAASEHGNEFRASFAELGARMSGEVEPYKKNMDEGERKKRRRALQLRFKRAYTRLEADQKATGLWFITVKSGGSGFSHGARNKSLIRVDVDALARTVELARAADDYADFRVRCFERAAQRVCGGMKRHYVPTNDASTENEGNEARKQAGLLKRYESNIKTYSRKLYNYAASQAGFSEDVAGKLKERIQANLDRWFAVDFPTLLQAEKEDAERAAKRPERMNELTRQIKVAGSKVHTSDHHTNTARDADVCTFGDTTQAEISTPPVILNEPLGEQMVSDTGEDETVLNDALRALDLVRSIGAWRSTVILVDDATKQSEVLAKEATLDDVKKKFPAWLDRSEREQKSLVVDLKPSGRRIIQVDEANAEVMQLLAPVSFMMVETSHNNGQVWLALPDGLSAAEIEAVRERLFPVLKAKGANKGASGGLRWVGTHNFKPERKAADGNFPRVRLLASTEGRITSAAELESLNLLAAPQSKPLFKPKGNGARHSNRAKRAPSYDYAIGVVRRKPNGDIDRSAVDFHYAATCLNWGWSESETIDLLNTYSAKAKERRDNYAEKVVAHASRVARPEGM